MLISHKHKYIFIKTAKVAGTSVEIFFEQISFGGQPKDVQPEIVNEEGVVGYRGATNSKVRESWYNHMTLNDIKNKLSNDKLFNEYFKFSITRNPWDRIVSNYHHHYQHKFSFNAYIKPDRKWKFPAPIIWVLKPNIDDVHFIRFENLKEGIEGVCKKLGLDYDINNLKTYKSEYRTKHSRYKHYTEYYDDEAREIVAEKYAKDIEYFGYEFGE